MVKILTFAIISFTILCLVATLNATEDNLPSNNDDPTKDAAEDDFPTASKSASIGRFIRPSAWSKEEKENLETSSDKNSINDYQNMFDFGDEFSLENMKKFFRYAMSLFYSMNESDDGSSVKPKDDVRRQLHNQINYYPLDKSETNIKDENPTPENTRTLNKLSDDKKIQSPLTSDDQDKSSNNEKRRRPSNNEPFGNGQTENFKTKTQNFLEKHFADKSENGTKTQTQNLENPDPLNKLKGDEKMQNVPLNSTFNKSLSDVKVQKSSNNDSSNNKGPTKYPKNEIQDSVNKDFDISENNKENEPQASTGSDILTKSRNHEEIQNSENNDILNKSSDNGKRQNSSNKNSLDSMQPLDNSKYSQQKPLDNALNTSNRDINLQNPSNNGIQFESVPALNNDKPKEDLSKILFRDDEDTEEEALNGIQANYAVEEKVNANDVNDNEEDNEDDANDVNDNEEDNEDDANDVNDNEEDNEDDANDVNDNEGDNEDNANDVNDNKEDNEGDVNDVNDNEEDSEDDANENDRNKNYENDINEYNENDENEKDINEDDVNDEDANENANENNLTEDDADENNVDEDDRENDYINDNNYDNKSSTNQNNIENDNVNENNYNENEFEDDYENESNYRCEDNTNEYEDEDDYETVNNHFYEDNTIEDEDDYENENNCLYEDNTNEDEDDYEDHYESDNNYDYDESKENSNNQNPPKTNSLKEITHKNIIFPAFVKEAGSDQHNQSLIQSPRSQTQNDNDVIPISTESHNIESKEISSRFKLINGKSSDDDLRKSIMKENELNSLPDETENDATILTNQKTVSNDRNDAIQSSEKTQNNSESSNPETVSNDRNDAIQLSEITQNNSESSNQKGKFNTILEYIYKFSNNPLFKGIRNEEN